MAQVESLIARVVQARSQVLDAVLGVSPHQDAWKPAPTEWAIAECVEHLVVAEQGGVSGTWAAVEGLRAGNPVWKGELIHRGLTIEEVVRRPGPLTSKPRTAPCLSGAGRSVTGPRLLRTLNVSLIASACFSWAWTSKPLSSRTLCQALWTQAKGSLFCGSTLSCTGPPPSIARRPPGAT
jgi:hypothetical protein